MDNKENTIDKAAEAIAKELETMSNEGLREFFMFFYKINHYHSTMRTPDDFEVFLQSFDSNPFKVNEDKSFKKQLIENIIKYAHDHMSLITAAVLIKKKFTIEELTQNYYSSVDVFDGNWF